MFFFPFLFLHFIFLFCSVFLPFLLFSYSLIISMSILPPYSILGVTAEVQRPMLILADSSLHIDTCYTSVPIKHTLTLINLTKLHTNFQWINESVRHI